MALSQCLWSIEKAREMRTRFFKIKIVFYLKIASFVTPREFVTMLHFRERGLVAQLQIPPTTPWDAHETVGVHAEESLRASFGR